MYYRRVAQVLLSGMRWCLRLDEGRKVGKELVSLNCVMILSVSTAHVLGLVFHDPLALATVLVMWVLVCAVRSGPSSFAKSSLTTIEQKRAMVRR